MGRPKGSRDQRKRLNKKKWKIEDIIFLKKHFYDMTLTQLSQKLNRPKSSISIVAKEHGMCKIGTYHMYQFNELDKFDFTGVYLIGHNINNMLYIGSSDSSIRDRIMQHINQLNKGTHINTKLQKDWNIDIFHFGIIKQCSGLETATLEYQYIQGLDNRLLYNQTFTCKQTPQIDDIMYDKLQNRIDKSGDCWIWTGKATKGYGEIQINNKRYSIHRVIYAYHNGRLDGGVIVRHQCHNKLCVKPDHLLIGTTKDNVHDNIRDGLLDGPRPRPSRFTEQDVLDMYKLAEEGKTLKEIGKKFNVHNGTISLILRCKGPQSLRHVLKDMPIVVNSKRCGDNGSKKYEAFGEYKTLCQWSKDSRCHVGQKLLEKRINKGMSLEDAILTPRPPKKEKKIPKKRLRNDWDQILIKLIKENPAIGDSDGALELSRICEYEIDQHTYIMMKNELIKQKKVVV